MSARAHTPKPAARALSRSAVYATLALVSLLYALPLLWMVSTSIKPEEQAISQPPMFVPAPPPSHRGRRRRTTRRCGPTPRSTSRSFSATRL